MGEHAIVEIADALDAGLPIDQITYINGTVYRTSSLDEVYDYDLLPSWDDLAADKLKLRAQLLTCSSRTWTPSPGIAW